MCHNKQSSFTEQTFRFFCGLFVISVTLPLDPSSPPGSLDVLAGLPLLRPPGLDMAATMSGKLHSFA